MTQAIDAVQVTTQNAIAATEQAFMARFNAADHAMMTMTETLQNLTSKIDTMGKRTSDDANSSGVTSEPPAKARAVATGNV